MNARTHQAGFMRSLRAIAGAELALFRRFPRLVLAVIAIAMVPAAYALIYLSSVWDPNAKSNALPVGIVNLDKGYSYQKRDTNVGAELVAELIRTDAFGFRTMDDAQAAREAVRLGSLAFAVIIPEDFSAGAVPGVRPGGGQVTVVLSEGNNYASAGFARRFAADLGHQVNEALNEKRWEQVLLSVDGSGKSLTRLKAGMADVRAGAGRLSEGAAQYSSASAQLAGGFRQLGSGIKTIESKLPPDAEVKSMRAGTQRLVARQKELGSGLEQLQAGARKLTDGASTMREETSGIPFVGDKVSAGAAELATGGAQLTEGLGTALEGNGRLVRGATRLDAATEKMADGLGALEDGLRTLADKVPDDRQLEQFVASGRDLAAGAAKLRSGVALVESVLPASIEKLDGSARGLADSVEPALEVLAPVANNGSAFAPNMVAMALWLGAVMSVYLFNMRAVLAEHAQAPMLAKALGKFVLPALVVLLQSLLVFLMLVYGLGIAVPDMQTFALSMVAASLAFLATVYLLLRAFGEAGKLFAVLLLTLQLAAGGGVMPIELTGDFFQSVHDWLPFTWVVKTFRASLFGAFGNGWWHAWTVVVTSGLIALLLASFAGRWRTVERADYRPGIDI
ncbi:MAG: YhgE/Pip domain-containing protein [Gammaproteobacteria bacterium]|nr:YhgE/Pip domain-containing protein [Gammaproteobacteria bacterium]MBU0787056.1 YhgE/Pip domain-containing protein [Gammaproteobacteria bacterium]MBU0816307.1 YhgE/Pip domain-containing protein [Gammaproteobacteria bacterium]MBU1787944.1 YhgE/Pip domain-containing protein [Gammaproteobacteria bacterium]